MAISSIFINHYVSQYKRWSVERQCGLCLTASQTWGIVYRVAYSIDNGSGIAYDTSMSKYQIVIDTNVIVSALQSSRGASYKLLMLLGKPTFEINISIPLILEYEAIAKRLIGQIALTETDVDHVIDYVCKVANQHEIFFLWRPFLKDPNDDMVLELAVKAQCDFIVTYNQKDFKHIDRFGIEAITTKELGKR